jgi:thiosulfate/3-mercaptopyruvate sulfurtransferase
MTWSGMFLSLVLAAGDGYPRGELLIEPDALAKIDAGAVRILDARAKKKYDAGHIPGAVWVDHETWAKAFAKAQDPNDWAKRIGGVGVESPKTRVVVYDDALSKDAARIWWILRYWGVRDVRLLNGGWPGWTAGANKVSKDAARIVAKPYTVPEPATSRLATKDFVLGQVKDNTYQILDARSEAEHCGDTKLAKRGGAIPGAMHLEWSDALDKKTQRFKSPTELTKLLKDAGVNLDRPTVTYCQSGGRAAVMAFTLELMGAPEVRNYYRSWSEWGNADDTPVVTPKRPR